MAKRKIFKYFENKYVEFRDDYLYRSPKRKWDFIRCIAGYFLRMIGIPVVDHDFKVWWYSYMCAVCMANMVLSFLYTLWYYADEPLKGSLFVSMFGIFISVSTEFTDQFSNIIRFFKNFMIPLFFVEKSLAGYLMIMIPSQRKKLQSILFFADDHIYTDIDKTSDPVYISICDQSAVKLLKSTTKVLGLFYTSLITYTVFP